MNVSRIRRIANKVPFLGTDIKLELGCGDSKHRRKGYVGLDIEDYGQEIVWDMELGIPLPDSSCTKIYTSHTLEHVGDLIGVMNECWRILKPHGEMQIVVPHKDSEKAHVPSHVRFFDKWSWDFFQYDSYTSEYHSRTWKVMSLVVNDRPDIHVQMSPVKN